MFNADKQVQVKDVKVVSGALFVRLKGIKQDPRMQRPEAAGNEDWIVMGDVPGSDFSIMFWVQLLFSFHQGARDQDAPFFVDRDGGGDTGPVDGDIMRPPPSDVGSFRFPPICPASASAKGLVVKTWYAVRTN